MAQKLPTAVALVLVVGLVGCGSSSDDDPGSVSESSTAAAAASEPLVGTGSSLITPLMSRWQSDYERKTGASVTYRPGGNGVDIKKLAAGAVDFVVTDAPVSSAQFYEASVQMIPWTVSGTVLVYNLSDAAGDLRLDDEVLSGIFLGEITSWSDPAIAALNPDVSLPSTTITPVYPRGESGDTYVLTNYFMGNSERFRGSSGISRGLELPGGIAAKGDRGVASTVAKTDGAIGYVELPDALSGKLDVALIENKAGNFPPPSVKSIGAAAEAQSRVGPNLETSIAELPPTAKDAYPIAAYLYVVVPVESKKAESLKEFVNYAISPSAQSLGTELDFAAIPEKMVAAAKRVLNYVSEPPR